MTAVAIIGAGVGGLSAAIDLARQGHAVDIFEADDRAGGKAGIEVSDGVEHDTGPSVLTLPEVFRELFSDTGVRLDEYVELIEPKPAFRYIWPDGARFDVHLRREDTVSAARAQLGPRAAKELESFLDYAKTIWEAAAPNFVYGDAPTMGTMFQLGLRQMGAMVRIDGMRTMSKAISTRVRDPHVRDVLRRYATYNGSDVRTAPATLNCIAHVELALGGFGVRGGLYALIRAMVRRLEELGGRVHLGSPVERVLHRDGRVTGLRVAGGAEHAVSCVIANADVAHVAQDLVEGGESIASRAPPSMSGWTAVLAARPRTLGDSEPRRAAHTVLFPDTYEEEFSDIFDRDRPPASPTVYLCDQSLCHERGGWADGRVPVFVMANAPAEPEAGPRDPSVWSQLSQVARQRATQAGLLEGGDSIVWTRTPTDLAEKYRRSRGSIYGAASNSRWAAFQRPANRVASLRGLYLASGSAHPGGGVPLCALSGRSAARAVTQDTDND